MLIIDTDAIEVIKDLPEPREVVIVNVSGDRDNPVFTYKIPIEIDLRQALKSNISKFSMQVLNKSLSSITNFGFLDDTNSSNDPFGINNQINDFSEKNMIKMLSSQKDSILREFNVDFKEILNTQIMSKFENLTDEQLFGSRRVVIVGENSLSNSVTSYDLTVNLDDRSHRVEEYSFEEAIDHLYQEGGDPGSVFFDDQDEISHTQSKQGLTIKDYSKKKKRNSRIDRIKESIRNRFIDSAGLNPKSDGIDLRQKNESVDISSRLRTYEINQNLRIQKIHMYVDVDAETISRTGGYVHLAVNCYDMFGLIVDLREINLKHSSFSEDLSLFLPNLRVEATRSGVQKNDIVLEITNESFVEIDAQVYYKVTSECGSLDLMRFESGGVLTLDGKESKRIKYTGIDADGQLGGPYTGGSVLFRVVPTIKVYATGNRLRLCNTYYASVKSKHLERNLFIPIVVYNRENFVTIEAHSIPKNATSIEFYKRNITLREKNFKTIKNEFGSEYGTAFLKNRDTYSLEDYDVKDENSYEYKVKINFGGGESYMSLSSCIHEYLKRDTQITLDAKAARNIAGNLIIPVDVEKKVTSADKIFDQITSFAKEPQNVSVGQVTNGAFNLFLQELDQIKSLILNSVILRVTRFDTTTNDNLNVGEFNVEFNASSTNGTCVVVDDIDVNPGRHYIYKIQPHIRSTYELLIDVKSKLQELANQSSIPGINIIDQLVRTTNDGIQSSKGTKFYSRSNYKRGTLQDNKQSVEQVNGDLWLYGRSGNYEYTEYTPRENTIKIDKPRISIVKSVQGLSETYESKLQIKPNTLSINGPGIIPSFPKPFMFIRKSVKTSKANEFINDNVKIEFYLNGDPDSIDFFVITSLKNGQTRIVGSIHCPEDQSKRYTFIDASQVGYQGAVYYSLYAVTENKKIRGPFNLGLAIVGSGV